MIEFKSSIPELTFRYSIIEEDTPYLTAWLSDPAVMTWFPICNDREIEDTVRIWLSYSKLGACVTALWEGVPCGMTVLYVQPFKKFAHQCLFAIIVETSKRGKGIGAALLRNTMKVAKEDLKIELLHLEVYQGNPAIDLYKRLGFKEYGVQTHFIKDQGKYIGKVLMQKEL